MLESSSSSSRIARSLDLSIIRARRQDVLAHAQSAMRAPVEMVPCASATTAVVRWPTIDTERDVNQPRIDITDSRDVACLVNLFYDRVRDDDILGPIFDDIAHVDWPTHLPRMYDFWESVLFARATFKGTPLVVHRALARRTPLTTAAFDRWIALFQSTVDDLFSGPMAEHAKNSASRIAATMERSIGAPASNDASPLRDDKELVAVADHNP
jgi:hemoglobin